jgi:hypothetical protein
MVESAKNQLHKRAPILREGLVSFLDCPRHLAEQPEFRSGPKDVVCRGNHAVGIADPIGVTANALATHEA